MGTIKTVLGWFFKEDKRLYNAVIDFTDGVPVVKYAEDWAGNALTSDELSKITAHQIDQAVEEVIGG